ncbi:Mth938-like domain-containing protein [Pusillimonas sp. ANT_WB101]|uniref:Mth938-like domain-containing protein n=1 Tax=Pusillimonas sp. ANT_WB101 TaxID=2597356 RepID=UPI0011EBE6F7|nr:Mth938-like domain-containing protein [Pusillimonas sp. ANT_WB101]KAA0888488.1 hypothetical protein FQ179_21210 [Pusillimonas sp. ANT_WB101]
MELRSEANPALNTITAYGSGYVEINEVAYRHPVYFAPEGEIHDWPVSNVDDITTSTLRDIAGVPNAKADPMAFLDGAPNVLPDDAAEVLIIGTGEKQQLLPAHVMGPLLQMGIGIEAMTTQAAARTYNILMSEGRRVVVALITHQEAV